VIGWYVPPWMAEKYPDITDWKNLNKYAAQFKTSESGGKGQLLDGDPSYVTNDEALVKNLALNYKVVQSGSETALIQAFRDAEKNKRPLLAYFYEPQWFFNEVKLVKINLPAYKAGCDAVPAKVACDYPPYDLDKIVSKKFADSGSPAYDLVKKFQWTNEDQNAVARMIAVDKLTPDQAAEKWVKDNQSKVDAWLGK
jgi:glycine betaine/proline transport system substrate-binding protein